MTGDNATGVVSYGTEAGQFQDAGYSAVVCGPGDIAQAHQADEYLELSEFQAGLDLLKRQAQTDPNKLAAIGYCFGTMKY